MGSFLKILLIVHISAGAMSLLFGAIAFAFRKNTPKHKPFGRIYFWCMTVVFVTAIILSVAKGLLFLFLIAVFSYYSTIVAYRSLSLKNLHKDQKPLKLDWAIEIVAGLIFIGMVVFGLMILLKKQSFGGIIPLLAGVFGLRSVWVNINLFLKKPTMSLYWLKKHVGHMMGSYIGALTAFLVNQTDVIPLNPTLVWLLPSIIITPVLIMEMKKVKSKPFSSEKESA